jgi:hypothetical protein
VPHTRMLAASAAGRNPAFVPISKTTIHTIATRYISETENRLSDRGRDYLLKAAPARFAGIGPWVSPTAH